MIPVIGKLQTKPDPKWTYDDFVRRIQALETEVSLLKSQVKVLVNDHLEDELERGQIRQAISQASYAMQIGLTSGPEKK